ncbi:MAG: alpha-glucosidase [Leptonema sp. (in: Bacteria)]|nr:alpha-glucosidase [Leptonema sp. (in: bacteria)]
MHGKKESVQISKDSESKIVARRKNFKFVQDPPTGNFRFDLENKVILRGQIANDRDRLFSLRLPKDIEIYGLGAFEGRKDRNQGSYLLRNIDTFFYLLKDQSYTSFPFLFFRDKDSCTGVLINSSYPLKIEIVRNQRIDEDNELTVNQHLLESLSTEEQKKLPIDFVIFSGSAAEILKSYAQLTGQPFLPPIWALGYHQSRWSYRSQDKVVDVALQARQFGLPLDAIHLDIHYMDRYRVFTWNPKTFAEPEQLNSKLKELGVRTVAIVDPGVAYIKEGKRSKDQYSVFESGLSDDHFCKQNDGSLYLGKVWPGVCAFPDFTQEKTRYWWARLHKSLFNAGVSGIWNDMNEPVLKMGKTTEPLLENIQHYDGSHFQYRNLYANFEAEATNDAFATWRPGQRPFVLTRSGFTGIQKYAALWTGDNISTWQHLRDNLFQVINLGLSGVPFVGADIGGFGSRPGKYGAVKIFRKPELFQRWVELGSLMPFFRIHTTLYSYSQDPWSYGPDILARTRKHILRRYSLLPYLYSLFWKAHLTGAPIVRPVFYEFPTVDYESTSTQFMVGPMLLSAPVVLPNVKERKVVLPPGEWFEFETGDLFRGSCEIDIPVSPGYYPLFVRSGSVLPLCKPDRNAIESISNDLFIEIYPDQEIKGQLILDDGHSMDYQTKQIFEVTITGHRDHNGDLTIEWKVVSKKYSPPQTKITLRLPLGYRQMTLKRKKTEGVAHTLSSEERSVQMMEYELPLAQDWQATFTYRNAW